LSLLVDALFGKIKELQKPPYHPKWKEVTQHAALPGWTRFPPAQEWLDKNAVATAPPVEGADRPGRPGDESRNLEGNSGSRVSQRLLGQFRQFLSERGPAAGKVDAEGLLRAFMGWQASRQVTR